MVQKTKAHIIYSHCLNDVCSQFISFVTQIGQIHYVLILRLMQAVFDPNLEQIDLIAMVTS